MMSKRRIKSRNYKQLGEPSDDSKTVKRIVSLTGLRPPSPLTAYNRYGDVVAEYGEGSGETEITETWITFLSPNSGNGRPN